MVAVMAPTFRDSGVLGSLDVYPHMHPLKAQHAYSSMFIDALPVSSIDPGPPIQAGKARQVRAFLHLGFGIQTLINTPTPS